jgi:hypothetical protein
MARKTNDGAFDSVDPLPRALLRSVERKLIASAMSGKEIGTSVTPEQRALICEFCEQARLEGHHSERLLVAFKGGLSRAATELHVPAGPDRNTLISRLVSAFIQEFYGGVSAAQTDDLPAPETSAGKPKPNFEATPEATT